MRGFINISNKTGINSVKKPSNWWINLIFVMASICCIAPFVMVVVISFSSEKSVIRNGYAFIPEEWSLSAYRYLLAKPDNIVRAYGVTIFTMVVGTIVSLIFGSMVAYVISRKDYPYKKILTFYMYFTMLFSGGLTPSYVMYVNTFHIKNTIWALLIPNMLLSAWNIILMRTYFSANIPESLVESAYMDGAGEMTIYSRIVLPLAKPILSSIGFMTALGYWNSWFNCSVYVTNNKLYSLNYLMTKALMDIQQLKALTEIPAEMKAMLGQMPSETVRMAMAVVGAGPMILAFPFFQKYFVKGLVVGSVKG